VDDPRDPAGSAAKPGASGRTTSSAQETSGQAGKPDVLWATIHTKRREGIDLLLYQPAGRTTLGRIAGLGAEREITPHRNGLEVVKLRLKTTAQVTAKEFRGFLRDQSWV